MRQQIQILEARAAMALRDAAIACRELAGPPLNRSEDADVWIGLGRVLDEKVGGLLTPGWRGLSQPNPRRL